jgi:hypothetical protein
VRGARRLSQWAADAVWLQVFDVSRGAKHYAPGGGYAGFAGRDGTRAFVSGEFTEEGLTDDVAGLSDEDAAGVIYWRDFYRSNYTFLGLLTGGAFYDAAGEPLPPVEAPQAGAAEARGRRDARRAVVRRSLERRRRRRGVVRRGAAAAAGHVRAPPAAVPLRTAHAGGGRGCGGGGHGAVPRLRAAGAALQHSGGGGGRDCCRRVIGWTAGVDGWGCS